MRLPRSSGILLHPTSLPGPDGVGDLGPGARRFVDWLAEARQSVWQVLPLGPTGYGDSPYQCFSAFAGNPVLVSADDLVTDGLLEPGDLASRPHFPADRVDFGAAIAWKRRLLERAVARFRGGATPHLSEPFAAFCREEAWWLDDYALFTALKEAEGGAPWYAWPAGLAQRDPSALTAARADLAEPIRAVQLAQFLFARQLAALRSYAAARGIRLLGDMPIFVAHDGADVWARRSLFLLDGAGRPTVVAGVPPDYFSATGQLWGNPLYDWHVMVGEGYRWWVDRFRRTLAMVDIVRIDHVIGFTRFWEVPAGETTALHGRWRYGPGGAVLQAVYDALGRVPIVAEDLGIVTPEVDALLARFRLPGMRVLHFAFGGDPRERALPHNFRRNCVVYTGTHDNDTTVGWFASLGDGERSAVQRYLGRSGEDIAWDLIRLALSSIADTAVIPMQDVLSLGSGARMNRPGSTEGNWTWRLAPAQLDGDRARRLAELVVLYGRAPR